MFTLANLDTETPQESGAWLHLTDPRTGLPAYIDEKEEKPCRVKLKGWQSDLGKSLVVKSRNKMMREAVKQGKKQDEITLEDLKENAESDSETLAQLALDWENILGQDGKSVEFSKANFKNACLNALDLRKQCLDFINDQRNFLQA